MLNRDLVFPFSFVLSKLFHILQCYHRNSKIRNSLCYVTIERAKILNMLLLCYDIKSKK